MDAEHRRFAQHNPLLPLAVALLMAVGPGLAACDGDTIVDLELSQSVIVSFDEMRPDTPKEAVVGFADLRQEERYVELADTLRCSGIDMAKSKVTILKLEPTGLEATLSIGVDVAPAGQESWTPMMELDGAVVDREVVTWSDERVLTVTTGTDLQGSLVLSDRPIYDVRLVGETAQAVDDLQIELEIVTLFSDDPNGCP